MTSSELRKDPIVGRWVIIATERVKRPTDFKSGPQPTRTSFCPFCEGNEGKTPKEIMAYRDSNTKPNTPGWRVRVVPNKFPALQIEGALDKRGVGIYDMMSGIGAHEVFVESPRHDISLTALSEEHIREVLWAYRERLLDLKKDKRFVYGMLFKNVGSVAGASLEHTHSQLIVTPTIPKRILEELEGANQFFQYRGRCIFCDIARQELGGKERLVIESEHFLAFTPFASRFPFETWIMPKQHTTHFDSLDTHESEDLATVLKSTLIRIETILDKPPYNYVLHTAPFNTKELQHYHWHIEIIPRLTKVAGFEWGTGFYINPVPPEDAAKFLQSGRKPNKNNLLGGENDK